MRILLQKKEPHTVDKFTFMQQLEQDAAMRAENRRNREIIADNFRRYNNHCCSDKNVLVICIISFNYQTRQQGFQRTEI